MKNDNNAFQKEYRKRNYKQFPIDISPEMLEEFKAACEKNSTKPTTEIKRFIAQYIEQNQ